MSVRKNEYRYTEAGPNEFPKSAKPIYIKFLIWLAIILAGFLINDYIYPPKKHRSNVDNIRLMDGVRRPFEMESLEVVEKKREEAQKVSIDDFLDKNR